LAEIDGKLGRVETGCRVGSGGMGEWGISTKTPTPPAKRRQ